MRCLIVAALCLAALPARSQDWASYEICYPDRIEIHDSALAPFTLAGLQAAAEAIPNATGRYWQITAPDGGVSHLWGTMHSNHPAILALPARVEADVRGAKVVAVETDFILTSRADYTNWAGAEELLRGDDGTPTFTMLDLPPHVEHWIRHRTDGIGWGSDAPEYLSLAGLASMILGDPCTDFAAGVYPGQDGLIQMYGAIEGARVIGLEPPDTFLDTLDAPQNFELTRSIIGIYGAYLNPDRNAAETATGYALYQRGQIGVSMLLDRAYAMHIYGEDEARRMLDLTNGYLVDARNKTFLQTALEHLEQGGTFLAIGSFHLPGERGMVKMLRDNGFAVERIALPGEVSG